LNEPKVSEAKYKFDFSSKFILRPDLFSNKIYFVAGLIFQTKFILRFDFLNITVRHEIGKRYIYINTPTQKGFSS